MEDLQEATENICRLKGTTLALEVALMAVFETLSLDQKRRAFQTMARQAEAGHAVLLADEVSERVVEAFVADAQRLCARLEASQSRQG